MKSLVQGLFLSTFVLASTAYANGTFYQNLKTNIVSVFPITNNDGSSQTIASHMFESLLDRDENTYDWRPLLAEKWEISKDGKEFKFWLNPKSRFWDGTPVTAEDVKFSFELINMPGVDSSSLKPYYSEIEKVEVINSREVKFKVKSKYFKNFDVAAGVTVFPKKQYLAFYNKDKSMSKGEVTRKPLGSGPWQLEKWDDNQRVILKRNETYWNKDELVKRGAWNFDKLHYRMISEESVEFESFKKGEISYLGFTPKQWQLQTNGKDFLAKITKVKAENKAPTSYSFIGWNNNHPILGNKDVRWALSHLANLPVWSQKFDYNLTEPAISPIGPKSEAHDKSLKPVPFDLNAARKRLAAAGWSKADKDGVLIKDGKRFEVTILYPIQAREHYEPKLTEYRNQAKKVGVQIDLKGMEWTSFLKMLDDKKFDAVSLVWGRAVESDFKQIFHSSSIAGNGDNFVSYKNEALDKLIDAHRIALDKTERMKIAAQIEKLIYNDQPYTFLTERKSILYGHQKNIVKPRDTFNYTIGTEYWKFAPQ